MSVLMAALGVPEPADPGTAAGPLGGLAGVPPRADHAWLVLAVLGARLPDTTTVTAGLRGWRTEGLDGLAATVAGHLRSGTAQRRVRVVTDRTVVDIGDLVSSPLRTGIQRVARGAATEWSTRPDVVMAAWTAPFDGLRVAGRAEVERALGDDAPVVATTVGSNDAIDVLVPWRTTYVLPELAVEPDRCAALQALAEHSGNRTGVVGFDCVPLTTSETAAVGFPNVFALNLAAVARFDVVAAISRAAAAEYEGWRAMLHGAGLHGPSITAVPLPVHAPAAGPDAVAEARELYAAPDEPLVLCVGSHEPRKNHLALLHAAEVLWRRGRRFRLVFVGGHSWGSEEFRERVAELQARGRPILSISRITDRLLWALYRIAHVTAFPSLNEGFGLPVAESLAAGTPVITSDFGSMKEIAGPGGALLVDPRSDDALIDALDAVLTEPGVRDRLAAGAAGHSSDSWQRYADALWDAFHER